jgi:hypothetical protein
VNAVPPEIIAAAERGWCLHPVQHRRKIPLLKDWQHCATPDLKQIEAWERKYPGCNWGAVAGPESGFFAVDVDDPAAMQKLEDEHEPILDGLCNLTSHGYQLIFEWPNGANVRPATNRPCRGIDIRGRRSYIVIPPSIHPTGHVYHYSDDSLPIPACPPWLLTLILNLSLTDAQGRQSAPLAIGVLVEGQRNDGLFRFGCALRRKGWTLEQIEAELLKANARRCDPPLDDKDVGNIAASAASYAVGSPDPLELAWKTTQQEVYPTRKAQFLALCWHLQRARAGQSVALPLERIGLLFTCHWSTIAIYRREAVTQGWLEPAEEYIAHRRAAQYRVTLTREDFKTLTTPTNNYGLVRRRPSENKKSPSKNFLSENWLEDDLPLDAGIFSSGRVQ